MMEVARVHPQIILLVGAIVGMFGLAMLCLACSMMRSRDHGCCRRRRNEGDDQHYDDAPFPSTPSYATVNEFVFAADSDDALGMVHDMGPTTMERLFPDLLAGTTIVRKRDGAIRAVGRQSHGNKTEETDKEDGNKVDAQLREPLL
jgi:hypothetical protein